LDSEAFSKVEDVLEDLEEKLLKRIPEARHRSPETLIDEIEALDIVLDLESRLSTPKRPK
jgi:predicted KAP-like P-loop ATPase